MREDGYVVLTVSAPASTEEITFQGYVGDTPGSVRRLRDAVQAYRKRYKAEHVATLPSRIRGAQGFREGRP